MQRFCSMFSQLLQLFPRLEFEQLVNQHRAQRHARGFECWTQFVAMLFCQLGRAHSLREICGGLASCVGKLSHLGVQRAPVRSTLAYANEHRPAGLYRDLFFHLLDRCRQVAGRHKFRFKHKLVSLDATVIDLCAEIFDWAKFRRTKGAVKLHLLLDHDGYLPCFAVITPGQVHEINVARRLRFEPGTILVMDRGYLDYRWLDELTARGVYFVTRLKDGAVIEEAAPCPIPKGSPIQSDQIVGLPGSGRSLNPGRVLRRIVVVVPETGAELVLLTNQLTFSPVTIAAIYRERWQIELLFKALKQNLKIKTFVGTSANALHIQIWTALIALLILKYLQLKSRWGWSLSNLVALLRMNLFVHRDLWAWLDQPFAPPPEPGRATQQASWAFA